MIIQPLHIRALHAPKDTLLPEIFSTLEALPEKSILAISSKVVSISEGQTTPDTVNKDELIEKDATLFLDRSHVPSRHVLHTITHNVLIASAGIDLSNGNGYFIHWPKDPRSAARILWDTCHKHYGTKKFGIIITDSRSIPLRRGAIGFALSFYGFEPLRDYVGTKDIFGRKLRAEKANLADGLAASAVLSMGEGNERTPLALITDIPSLVFTTEDTYKDGTDDAFEVTMEDDIYAPFLKQVPWQKGGSSDAHIAL